MVYGPPEWDWSNKARVRRDLKHQIESRGKKAVYFSDWDKFGQHIRASKNVRNVLWREANKILSNLRGGLREMGDTGREVAGKMYIDYQKRDGKYNDRPFAHISERSFGRKPGDPGFNFLNFRAAHSDKAWSRYISAMNRRKADSDEPFDSTAYMDRQGLRDEIVERYLSRNKNAYGYDPRRNSPKNPYT